MDISEFIKKRAMRFLDCLNDEKFEIDLEIKKEFDKIISNTSTDFDKLSAIVFGLLRSNGVVTVTSVQSAQKVTRYHPEEFKISFIMSILISAHLIKKKNRCASSIVKLLHEKDIRFEIVREELVKLC